MSRHGAIGLHRPLSPAIEAAASWAACRTVENSFNRSSNFCFRACNTLILYMFAMRGSNRACSTTLLKGATSHAQLFLRFGPGFDHHFDADESRAGARQSGFENSLDLQNPPGMCRRFPFNCLSERRLAITMTRLLLPGAMYSAKPWVIEPS